jgi:hypothetical protein
LVADVSEKVRVARTSATVEEKGDCVQQFLRWPTGSPNIYELKGYGGGMRTPVQTRSYNS